MANEQLKLTVELAAKKAVQDLQALAKESKKAGDAIEEIDPKSVAQAFDSATDQLIADLKASQRAADALGQAVGPELRASLGEARIDDFVGDLKRAGLSFEQIEQNADQFAGSLRKLDGAADSVSNVEGKLHKMAGEGDNSRSVLANMVGNSAQDLGALGGVAGSAGVALGQLAEYASEGNISLGGFAKVAGPMAAVGLAVAALSSVMEENAKQQKFLKDQTLAFSNALETARKENKSTTRAIVDDWSKGDKIEAQISNATATLVEFGEATDDMGRIHDLKYPTAQKRVVDFAVEIDKLGMKAEDMARLAQQPIDKIQEWGAEMVASGKDAAQVNLVMQGAAALHVRLADAAATDAVNARVFGDSMDDTAKATGRAKDATNKLRDSLGDLNNIQLDALSTRLDVVTQSLDLMKAQEDYNQSVKDGKTPVTDLATAANDLAQKQADLAKQQGIANGHTQTAAERTGILLDKYNDLQKTLEPGSPLWNAIEAYKDALLKIPTNISTRISITGAGAGNAGRLAPGAGQGPDGTRSTPNGITVNVNAGLIADKETVGRHITEAIHREYKNGTRYPWMGGN